MRCGPIAAAMALALGALPAPAQTLPAAWQNWRCWRELELPPAPAGGWIRAPIPSAIYAQGQADLDDLRLIDDRGHEVPFILHARLGKHERQWRSARMLDLGFDPGSATQWILDAGERPEPHNAVELQTSEKDFFARAELATSEDGAAFQIVRTAAPIYRFSADRLPGNQLLRYPESRARYLRVRILQGERAFPLQAARLLHEVQQAAERAPLPARWRRVQTEPRQSWWDSELAGGTAPISMVRFEVEQPEFHRPVQIRASRDGASWPTVGSGAIYRMRDPQAPDRTLESLEVSFPEQQARHWRVIVFDRNDPPLDGARPRLYSTPRRVVFQPEPKRRYRLLYGNSEVEAATYELARLADPDQFESAALARLGAERVNSSYLDPRPWSERHPALIWAALGIALAALGLLAVAALRGGHLPSPTGPTGRGDGGEGVSR